MLINISMHQPETNFCCVADKSCPLDTFFACSAPPPPPPPAPAQQLLPVDPVDIRDWQRLGEIWF